MAAKIRPKTLIRLHSNGRRTLVPAGCDIARHPPDQPADIASFWGSSPTSGSPTDRLEGDTLEPVDLNLTPKELAFRDEVRAWFAANTPHDWVARRNAEESMEARFAYLRAWQRKLFDAGWAGVSWPVEY